MPAIVEEITDGQNAVFASGSGSRVRVFTVEGVLEPELACAAAGIPTIGTYYSGTYWWLICSSVEAQQYGRDDLYKVTCTYSWNKDDGKPKDPVDGTEYWTIDISGQNCNRKTAYAQTKFGAKAIEHGNLVGVNGDGSVDGVDVLIPSATLAISTWKTPASVTSSYINGCLALVGRYNNATFYGFAAGEILFSGVRIVNKGSVLYELEFNFLIQKNETAGDLPEFIDWSTGSAITVTGGKKGHQYLWVEPAEKDNAGVPQTAIKGVYLADVYKSVSFAALGLSGSL